MLRAFISLLLMVLAFSVSADSLKVKQAWVPAAPPGQTVLAAYMTLQNTGSESVTLVSACSEQFRRVEFHRSFVENGMARMQAHDELTISAGESLVFEPGGYHLMLIGLETDLAFLKRVNINLQFAGRAQLTIEAPVRSRGLDSGHHHHHH